MRALKSRAGGESGRQIASLIELAADAAFAPPFADLAPDANMPVPLPGGEPADVTWNTPEVPRGDAELARRTRCRGGGGETAACTGNRARAVGVVMGASRRHQSRAAVAPSRSKHGGT